MSIDYCILVDKTFSCCALHDVQMYIAGLLCMPNGPQHKYTDTALPVVTVGDNSGQQLYQMLTNGRSIYLSRSQASAN